MSRRRAAAMAGVLGWAGPTARRWFVAAALGALLNAAAFWLLLTSATQSVSCLRQPVPLLSALGGCLVPGAMGLALSLMLILGYAAVQQVIALKLQNELALDTTEEIVRAVDSLPYEILEDNAFQSRYGLALREASGQLFSLGGSVVRVLSSGAAAAVIGIQLAQLSPPLSLTVAAAAIPIFLGEWLTARAVVRLINESAPHIMRLQVLTRYQADPRVQRDLRILRSRLIPDQYQLVRRAYVPLVSRMARRTAAARGAVGAIQFVLLMGALTLVAYFVSRGWVSWEALLVFAPAAYAFVFQVQALSSDLGRIVEAVSVLGLLATVGAVGTPTSVRPVAAPSPERAPGVELARVDYRYPSRSELSLDGVTVDLGVGLHVVVGPNGSGKTTLLKVVSGLLDPTMGNLRYREPVAGWRTLVSGVMQDPAPLQVTAREYVTAASGGAGTRDDRLLRILTLVGMLKTLEEAAGGVDTVLGLGFGGETELSGGEWKRLAIARALYQESLILVLDEPETGLDVDGMVMLRRVLHCERECRLVLLATHMPELMRAADSILVVSGGRLLEHGSHAELAAQGGYYAKEILGGDA